MEYVLVTPQEIADTEGLDDWRYEERALHAEFACDTFPGGAALVSAIADAAEAAQHHPDIGLRYPGVVRVTLATHAVGDVTTFDVEVAQTISALAAAARATSRPLAAQVIEVAIDTMDADRIKPFWRAALGYVDAPTGALVDPARIGPSVWFQQMTEPRPERNRFHLDISVPHDEAGSRIDAALAAGGTMVTDEYARSWWVLGDADGNEACICTWQDRSSSV